jgi:hypothetical protein
MTLTERLQQGRAQYHHKRNIAAERAAMPDCIGADWIGANMSQAAQMAPRCMHCGVVGYNVAWQRGYNGVWYAICANVNECANRAHGAVN